MYNINVKHALALVKNSYVKSFSKYVTSYLIIDIYESFCVICSEKCFVDQVLIKVNINFDKNIISKQLLVILHDMRLKE